MLCLCFAAPALANSWGLPGGMFQLFDRPVYANYHASAMDEQLRTGHPGDVAAFALGNALADEKVLFVLERGGDGWNVAVENMLALFPGKDGENWPRPEITVDETGLLKITYALSGQREEYLFRSINGVWLFDGGTLYPDNGAPVTIATVGGRISYTSPGMYVAIPNGGAVPLQSFSVHRIPRTIEQATEAALGLEGFGFPLPGGLTRTVPENGAAQLFTGPGAGYPRAGGGKASLSTSAPFVVYGEEDGMLLVEYAVSAKQYRFGYIEKTAVPGVEAESLRLAHETARVVEDAALTDDPTVSQTALMTLRTGDTVTFLAVLGGDWALVEAVMPDGTPVRGFVRTGALQKL